MRRSDHGLVLFGRTLDPSPRRDTRPDWQQASVPWIKRALSLASALPSGGWYVLDAARAIRETPRAYCIRGRALVAFRDRGELVVAPEACPHLGASLAGACVRDGKLICPWHGLLLGRDGHAGWKPLASHEDGVLAWVRLDDEAGLSVEPVLAARPVGALASVVRLMAACEPRDIIQNRLDPWHGTHFHPYAFGSLRVIDQDERAVTVRVGYKLLGKLAIEVDARFHCPDPRTIVMTIVAGEGQGSVVETHATPAQPGSTAIIEATLAHSQRRGFAVARALGPALRPLIALAARRLWRDDAAYAERLYTLRNRADSGSSTTTTQPVLARSSAAPLRTRES